MAIGAWIIGMALASEPESAAITLPEAIEEALGANLELRQEAVAVGLAEVGLVRARGQWDPSLSVGVSTSASNSPNNDQFVGRDVLTQSSSGWSASLGQAVPGGGQLSASWSENRTDTNDRRQIEPITVSSRASLSLDQPLLRGAGPTGLWDLRRSNITVSRAQLAWRGAVEQAILDVSTAYWQLVAADQRFTLAVQSRSIAESSVGDMQERYDAGFVGTGDVLQMQRAFGAARQREITAEAARQQANNRLCRLLGRDVRRPPRLVPSDAPVIPETVPEEAEVLAQALVANARFRQATLDLDDARLAVAGARSQALPDLSVNGRVGLSGLANDAASSRRTTLSGDFNDWSVGANLSVPLLGRSTRAGLRQARLDAENARIAREAAEQDLVLRVQDAVRAAQRDRLRVELATETERVAALALTADQELLAEGRGSSRNVAQSLELLQQSGVDLLEARIGLQGSLLELQRVAGTLVGPNDVPDPTLVRSAEPR